MKIKDDIEELNAKFEHLQYRVDNLRDYVKEYPPSDWYWHNFCDLLSWALRFDKNSEEYKILTKTAWKILDKYLKIIL